MTPSQVESGHAFEYGIAASFRRIYGNATLVQNSAARVAEAAFQACDDEEQDKIFRASDEAAAFLVAHDLNLRMRDDYQIALQSDMAGARGDVRDVIISNTDSEVGISAKNRHTAVKNPRLSERNDFGRRWFGIPVSPEYFHAVGPIFGELRTLQRRGAIWNDVLETKAARFYIPVLTAFREEVVRLCDAHPEVPQLMVAYMLGNYDFYKVTKENGDVSLQSFNLRGTLGWGRRINLPTRLVEIREKAGFDNTLVLIFDGWQFSFRLHSAETRIIPSMKFDVRIESLPNATSQDISYG